MIAKKINFVSKLRAQQLPRAYPQNSLTRCKVCLLQAGRAVSGSEVNQRVFQQIEIGCEILCRLAIRWASMVTCILYLKHFLACNRSASCKCTTTLISTTTPELSLCRITLHCTCNPSNKPAWWSCATVILDMFLKNSFQNLAETSTLDFCSFFYIAST